MCEFAGFIIAQTGEADEKNGVILQDKPKIVGSATLEIHYVMLIATLSFK